MLKIVKRFKEWRERQIIKSLIQETRRFLQLLGHTPETMTDQQIIIAAMSTGTSIFQGQAILEGRLSGNPNLVMGRVVEMPVDKNQIN